MSVSSACPACGLPLQVPAGPPGRSLQCLRCGAALVADGPGGVALQAAPAQAVNPFAEYPAQPAFGPAAYPPGFYPPPLMSREAALAKVRGPAIMLQLAGGLCGVAGAALPLLLLVDEFREDEVAYYVFLIIGVLAVAAGGFTVFCGLRMKALQSYMLVMAGVILLMLMGLLICPLAALPGIWPLIVLLDNGVKSNFDVQSPFSGS